MKDETYYSRKGKFMHHRRGYDENMPSKAREMWLGERAKRAGVTYLEEGTYTFTLSNGARLRVPAPRPSTHIPTLTLQGLRFPIPARVLRLGLPLLPQRGPL